MAVTRSSQNNLNPKIDVSVCIITWNGKNLLINCLRSIYYFTQDISIEIVVVDNGSQDGTQESLRSLFPDVHLISNIKNEGFTFANNQAIEASKGRYIMLLNNDTLFEMDVLSPIVKYLDNNSDVGVLGCRLRYPDGHVQTSAHSNFTWWDFLFAAFYMHRIFPKSKIFGRINMTFIDYMNETRDVDWVAGAALVVRASAKDQVGLLDNNIFAFSEDWEWCIRFKENGWRIVYFSEAEVVHFEGMSSHSLRSDKGDWVREWSILTASASALYVYSKLNLKLRRKVFLFNLFRRIFFASKALSYFISYIISGQPSNLGRAKGYAKAVLTSNKMLFKRYLRNSSLN